MNCVSSLIVKTFFTQA